MFDIQAANQKKSYINSLKLASKSNSVEAEKPLAVLGLGCFLVLIACCVVPESLIASAVSFFAMLYFAIRILYSRPDIIINYFPFWFAFYANIAGCAVAEFTQMYLSELQVDAAYVGSLPLLVFSRWLFLAGIIFLDSRIQIDSFDERQAPPKEGKASSIDWVGVATWGVLVVCVFAVIRVMDTTPASVLGIDRFEYAETYGEVVPGFIANALPYLMISPLFSIKRGAGRAAGILSIGLYLVFLVWIGVKFGTLFTLFCFALLVFSKEIAALGKKVLRKVLIFAIAIMLALVGFAAYSQSSISSKGSTDYLFSRMAQQGQLWWKTYANTSGVNHSDEFGSELEAFFGMNEDIPTVKRDTGIYKIMYFTAPHDVVERKLMAGSEYTEAAYAASYYYFGCLGPVAFSIGMALLAVFSVRGLINSLVRKDVVGMLIFGRFILLTRTALSTFAFSNFLDPLSLLSWGYLVLRALMRYCGRRVREQTSYCENSILRRRNMLDGESANL